MRPTRNQHTLIHPERSEPDTRIVGHPSPLRRINRSTMVALVIGIAVTLVAREAVLVQGRADLTRATQVEAASVAFEVETRLTRDVTALERMATRWVARGGTPRNEWEIDARSYLLHLPAVHALGWVDRHGALRWQVPLENPDLTSLFTDPIPWSDLPRDRLTLRALRLGARRLYVASAPLDAEGFDGFVVMLVAAEELFRQAVREAEIHGYEAAVHDAIGTTVFHTAETPPPGSVPTARYPLRIRSLRHILEVWARDTATSSSQLVASIIMPVGIVLFGLLAFVAHAASSARHRARELVTVNDALLREADEHLRTSAFLTAAEARYRDLYHRSPDMQVTLDFDGTILECNRTFAETIGVPIDALVGSAMADQYAPEFHDELTQTLTLLQQSEREIRHLDRILCARDGRRIHVSVNAMRVAHPLPSDTNAVCRVTLRDVSEQRRMQAALEAANDDLRRSNAELEQFAYVASHDLQEPLRMVTSYAQLLATRCRGQLDAATDEYLGFIVDGATRMRQLIKALLVYSRVGSHDLVHQNVDCQQVLDQTVRDLGQRLADTGGRVTADPLPSVEADPTQLGQLFLNLVGNGLKFRGTAPPHVHVQAELHGPEWVFSVRDNGIGLDMEFQDKIFEIFQRLHSRSDYEGTGIGLAISKRIVERHRGRIWVDSAPGHGTTFFFSLPCASSHEVAA